MNSSIVKKFKCTRFPRLAKIGLKFGFLNESVDLTKFGGEFTKDEIVNMIMTFGETNDLFNGGWILPDGEVLDFKRSDRSNNAIRHSKIFSAFSNERKEILKNHMSEKDLLWSDNSIAIDVCLAAGLIRYHFAEFNNEVVVYLSLEKKPTTRQMSVLRDLVEMIADIESSKFLGIFECNGTHVSYNDTRIFKLKFLNDIMTSSF